MKKLTPLLHFNQLQTDFNTFSKDIVRDADFKIVLEDLAFIRKDLTKFITSDEVHERVHNVSDDLNRKIS